MLTDPTNPYVSDPSFSFLKEPRGRITPSLQDRSILLIEENLFVQHSMKDFLNDLGVKTITTGNGREAINQVLRLKAKPNLVLFDLGHSIVRSWPALIELRSAVGEIPFIISSGLDDSLFKHEIDALKGCTYMQKPYTYERLAGCIGQCLRRKEA